MANNKPHPKMCSICGKTYQPNSSRQQRCDECRTKPCEWCGKPFTDMAGRAGRRLRFCSVECTNAWQQSPQGREQHRQQKMEERGNGETITCATCGKAFYRIASRLNVGHAYCSQECRRLRVELVCPVCGKTFRRPPSDLRTVNYCSDDCRNTGTMERTANGEIYCRATSLEVAGRAILNALRLPYREQQVIGGKFTVDAVLTEHPVIIQWDGDFWHGNPAKGEHLTAIQQTNIARDRKCNAYLRKCGYAVLRFWESDVHSRPSWVADEIRRALPNSANT